MAREKDVVAVEEEEDAPPRLAGAVVASAGGAGRLGPADELSSRVCRGEALHELGVSSEEPSSTMRTWNSARGCSRWKTAMPPRCCRVPPR